MGESVVVSIVSERGRRKDPIVLVVSEVFGSGADVVGVCTLSASIAEDDAGDLEVGRGCPRPPAPGIHVGVDIPEDMIPGVAWKNGGNT